MSRGGETRVALVTGARRGIGAAIAERLARLGFTIAIHYVGDSREAETVAQRCLEAGASDSYAVEADLSDVRAPRSLTDEVRQRSGSVDILVNNAAIFPHSGWEDTTIEEWESTLRVNVTAPFLLAQAALPSMRKVGWGRILNVTSVTVRLGRNGEAPYIASKAALVGLTRSLAVSVAEIGVTVNAISPGAIRTEEELGRHTPSMQADLDAEMLAVQALPRRLVAGDVGGAAAFLVSDEAAAITGQVLEVNGGWVMR